MLKTILVHVDGGPCQESRLRAAALLARAHSAHLVGSAATGLSMASYAVLNGAMAMPVSNREFQELREAVTVVLDDFVAQAERLGIHGAEPRMVEDADRDGLLLQARYADLVVVSQDLSRDQGRGRATTERGLPQYLALHGARPVLVVPDTYHGEPIPGDALVGWDGSMPAQRAINAALPLLAQAGTVHLALVNPDLQAGLHGIEPGADMAHYLARHGLKVDVAIAHTRATEGEALMDMARDCHAGLMVTGAFGHSRYREWILGGVTRDVLDHAPAPLLIAH
jgi:nucleotide-binding universal stress UspA family protein